jgi:hypothetical protein
MDNFCAHATSIFNNCVSAVSTLPLMSSSHPFATILYFIDTAALSVSIHGLAKERVPIQHEPAGNSVRGRGRAHTSKYLSGMQFDLILNR